MKKILLTSLLLLFGLTLAACENKEEVLDADAELIDVDELAEEDKGGSLFALNAFKKYKKQIVKEQFDKGEITREEYEKELDNIVKESSTLYQNTVVYTSKYIKGNPPSLHAFIVMYIFDKYDLTTIDETLNDLYNGTPKDESLKEDCKEAKNIASYYGCSSR